MSPIHYSEISNFSLYSLMYVHVSYAVVGYETCVSPDCTRPTEGRSLPGDSTLVCAAYHQFPLILNRIQRTNERASQPSSVILPCRVRTTPLFLSPPPPPPPPPPHSHPLLSTPLSLRIIFHYASTIPNFKCVHRYINAVNSYARNGLHTHTCLTIPTLINTFK